MSRTIDQRVVEMQFDNRQFESNVSTSMGTIDKLKKSLQFDGYEKSFSGIEKAVGKVDMSPLSRGIETVQAKFSAFEVMAVTALANITNSAVNAGVSLVKSLSLDQVTAGWAKYDQKTANVQTLVNSTGKSMEEINKYLDQLMWYSDETSYGFTDMTSSLATMVSAGGDIEKLIPLLEGAANATALAGKGAKEFSRVTQFALTQAYSLGYMGTMDWKTIEGAGVNSKQLIQSFIDAGEALGTIEKGTVTLQNFRNTLSLKWLTRDVMEQAFGGFAAVTEEIYEGVQNGEFDLYAEGLNKVGDKYGEVALRAAKSAQEAKTFTEAIDATKDAVSSGWLKTFEIIFGNYEEATVLWTDLANRLWDTFAASAEERNEVLDEWKSLGGRDMMIEAFTNIWEGLGSVIEPVREAFRDIFPKATADRLVEITKAIRDFTAKLKLNDEQAAKVNNAFKGLFSIISIGINIFKQIGTAIVKLLSQFKGLASGVLNGASSFGEWITNIKDSIEQTDIFGKAVEKIIEFIQKAKDKFVEFKDVVKKKFESDGFQNFFDLLKSIWDVITKITGAVAKVVGKIATSVKDSLQNGDISSALDVVNGGIFGGLLLSLIQFVKKITDSLSNSGDLIKGLKDTLDTARGCLEAWQQNINSKTLKNIAVAVAILAASLLIFSFIDAKKIGDSLTLLTTVFAELLGGLAILQKIDYSKNNNKLATNLIKLSAAILVMSIALKILSGIDPDKAISSIAAISAIVGLLVGAAKALETDKSTVTNFGGNLTKLAVAVGILAVIAKLLSTMSWEELGKAGAGIAGLITMLVAAAKILDGDKKAITKFAGQLIGLSIAVGILAVIAKLLSTMSWEELGKAGAGILGIITMLVAAAVLLNSEYESVTKFAGQLIGLSIAVAILTGMAKVLGGMSWEELAKAGAGLLGIITMLVAAAVIIGSAGASMGAFAAFSASVILLSAGLLILVGVMKLLSGMSIGEILKGLGTLVAVILLLAGSAILLSPILPLMAALSGVLLIFGAACLAIGGGIALLGVGIGILASALGAGAGVIAAGLTTIIAAVAGTIPLVMQMIGEGIIAFCNTIAGSAEAIGNTLKVLIDVLISILIEEIPKIADGLIQFAIQLLTVLTEYVPQLVDVLVNFIIELISSLATRLPDLIAAGIAFVGSLITAIADSIQPLIEQVIQPLISALGEGIKLISEGVTPIVGIIGDVVQGVLDALVSIVEQISPIIDSITELITGVGTTIKDIFTSVSDVITSCGEAISNTLNSIASVIDSTFNGIGSVIESIGTSIKSVLDGISGVIDSIGNAALNAGTGFEKIAEGVKTLSKLDLIAVAASMTTVATGLGEIVANSSGLAEAGSAMEQIANAAGSTSNAFSSASNAVTMVVSKLVSIGKSATDSTAAMGASMTLAASHVNRFNTVLKGTVESIKMSFATLATCAEPFVLSMATIGESVSNSMNAAITNITGSTARLSDSISVLLRSISDAITNKQREISNAFETIIVNGIKSISSKTLEFKIVGTKITQMLKEGLISNVASINKVFTSLANNLITIIRSAYKSFFEAGGYLVEGFAKGISSNIYKAVKEATALANAALNATRHSLKINSPSKKFEELGVYVPEGFAKGISKASGIVKSSVGDMAKNAISGIKNIGGVISDVINKGIDVSPSIRPVVDMNSIQNGTLHVSANISEFMTKPIDSMSVLMDNTQAAIAKSNGEVVSAILDLRNDLDKYYNSGDSEISLYMDSKKVASTLAKPMDRQLNILSTKRRAY